MISELQRAFDALIQSGELGKTDAQYINTLLPSISGEGLISKDEVIRQLFAGSKNPDGACRNFFSRIHAAAAQAAEAAQEQGDERRAAMFRSIDIRKSSAAAGMMQFSACAPKELPPVTARANRDYLPENYQPSTGCKPEDLPQLQREELSRRQEKAEEKRQCCLLEAGRKELYECHEFIEVRGERTEIHTAGERHLLRDRAEDEGRGKYREALVDLFDWLEHSEASLYALLGDYGMGKTFTCRIFAQRLAERCENEPNLPKPVYLDLRDVPTFVTVHGKTRQPTLEEMLETVLRLNGQDGEYTAKELISATRQGKLLCIFDGLDEKLVYYTADMRSQFLNELLRVFPQEPQDGQVKVKIIISCRTHHFETISQMDSFLLGLNRSGLRSGDYRALHLLPFSSEQIQALLTKILGAEEAAQIFAFIEDEAYLKDLAQRPFLLRQLSRLLPKLRELKNQGKPINAAGFYQALIEDCLNRDEEKNIVKPRHKLLLLTDLAAEFWQSSTQLWQIDRLNDWFCAWLQKQPELAAQYSSVDGQLLEKDLRNSTLLVRFGKQDFGFSHSSMQEFFLSKWLLRQWQEGEDFRMDKPFSWLTQQFVFDNLALLDEKELARLNKGLAATLARPWSAASDWALAIIAELSKQGRTLPELGDVDLRQSHLSNRQIRGLQGKTLLLYRAEAYESKWLNCQFQRIEIGQGNISGSLWRDCSWDDAIVGQPPLQKGVGVTLAGCRGTMTLPQLHYFPPAVRQTIEDFHARNWQQGHSNRVWSCCFSPGGSRILSASDDKTLKLWDAEGRCLQTFQGHNNRVRSCCFSPDGSRILSASSGKTLKLWEAKGRCLQTFQGHKDTVRSCCFSPDGSRILSASGDGTLRLWNLDGTVERIFAAREEQWYTAFFRNNQLKKIIGTELSWKMAHFVKDGKAWTLDETGCFEWVPAQY